MDVHQIIVFGFGLGVREVGEISLWRNVDFFHAEEELLGTFTHEGDKTIDPETYALQRIETDQLVLASSGDYDAKVHYFDLPMIGFKAGSDAAKIFVGFELQCRRGFQCDPVMRRSLTTAQRKMTATHAHPFDVYKMRSFVDTESDYYCYLLIRDDALYQFDSMEERDSNLERQKHQGASDSSKITIALGMPTLSVESLANFEEVAPIRIFLPSFLKSIKYNEWKRFRYVIYVGYDQGDRFFDNEEYRAKILQKMKALVQGKDVSFELIRFPYSKGWVTFLWNGLYVHAMKDGCDYFYQVIWCAR